MPKQIAEWNTHLKLWSKPGGGQLFEHWELYSETWPTSGMTQGGQAYELPKQAHRTNVSEFLSLPTPKANDGYKGNTQTSEERKAKGFYVDLPNVAIDLMPTPLVDDAKNTGHNEKRRATLASVVYQETNWQRFEPAIKRWEKVIGRIAPAPTRPDGKGQRHRLSPLFAEWLMGLPEGYITGLGLKRNDQLKLAGNGVVPAQAEMALRLLLEDDNLLERIKK